MSAGIDTGDTVFILVATALVLLMTPALGLFYAGLVRAKNTLNTFMMCLGALAVVAITWVAVGYSFAFGEGNDLIGGFEHAFLHDVGFEAREGLAIPHILFFAFQLTFCMLTSALVCGAVVERMRFAPFLAFIVGWSVLIYPVLAHWVWGGGWLADRGTLDFAGGVPVEMASGFSAFAAAIVVGARRDFGRQAILPHNAMFVLLGAGLLWFGWFGFNGGSGLAVGNASVLAFVNTLLTPACTLIAWFLLDYLRGRQFTAVGAATAIVVGCVGITPAAGYISPAWSMVLGALVAVPCWAFIAYRPRTRLDETLDVLGAHGLAGLFGMLFIGFFAQESWNGLGDGLLYGDAGQLLDQAVAVLVTPAYAFGGTFLLLKAIELVTPLRVPRREESVGMDVVEHGEEAYASGEGAILISAEREIDAPVPVAQP